MNAPVRQTTANNVTAALRGNGNGAPRSEATGIEQSRAVAEVQAMVVVAQSRRRDVSRALEAMQQSCGRMALAERAFFSFKRGGSSVNGASIQLARELARCWGNVNTGVRELDRDDARGRSEMMAFGWDLETNLRADVTFIVPHMRDKTGGPVALTDMRDIYENNANNAARRLREMIFACLPVWYREEGIALCRATLEKGESDEPLPLRISKMLAAYASIGISRERVEARFGGNVDNMTVVDLASYGILFRSIKNGEASKDDEFPTVTAGQVNQMLNPTAAAATSPATATEGSGQAATSSPAATGGDSKPEASGQPAETAKATEAAKVNLVPEGVGQEEIAGKIVALIKASTTVERVNAITAANADRMKPWTQGNRAKVSVAAEDRIEDIGKA